jgi:hypothetical protein
VKHGWKLVLIGHDTLLITKTTALVRSHRLSRTT